MRLFSKLGELMRTSKGRELQETIPSHVEELILGLPDDKSTEALELAKRKGVRGLSEYLCIVFDAFGPGVPAGQFYNHLRNKITEKAQTSGMITTEELRRIYT